MISLCSTLPEISADSAELLKIKCLFDSYKTDNAVLFWCSEDNDTVISLTSSNMIIYNRNRSAEVLEELKEFAEVINPVSIYSDYETLCAIDKKPYEAVNVMSRKADIEGKPQGDVLSSKEIYALLDVEGLSLPSYPDFAVDYCRRLNHGFANYFAIKGKCAVITFNSGENAIINGIASHSKGYGRIALCSALQLNYGKTLYVCCRDKVKGFYEKQGFLPLYKGGYWVKNYEHK